MCQHTNFCLHHVSHINPLARSLINSSVELTHYDDKVILVYNQVKEMNIWSSQMIANKFGYFGLICLEQRKTLFKLV